MSDKLFLDDSDVSELTELSSEEEDNENQITRQPYDPVSRAVHQPSSSNTRATRPSTQQATAKILERENKVKVISCLTAPRMSTFSVEMLYKWTNQGLINLNPDYQRGPVWQHPKQSNLIDSIIHNYYIPPIIFAVHNLPDGTQMRTCIDGKQRLTSMKNYMDGVIPHRDSKTNRKTWYLDNGSSTRKLPLIPARMKSTFESKQIAIVEYDHLTEEQEREIFQRVQLGVALTPAERLPAINGPYADLVRDIKNRIKPFTSDCVRWGDSPSKEFQSIAQCVFLISSGDQPGNEPTTTRLETFLNRKTINSAVRPAVELAMDLFQKLLKNPELGRPITRSEGKLTSVEFVIIAYLIHTYRNKLSPSQISDSIVRLRKDVRETLKGEVRFNTKTFRYMMDFVLRKAPKSWKGNKEVGPPIADPKANWPAPVDVPVDQAVGDGSGDDVPQRPVKKRKRVIEENSEMITQEAVPSTSKASTSIASKIKSSSGMVTPGKTMKIKRNNKSNTTAQRAATTATVRKPTLSPSSSNIRGPQVGIRSAKISGKPRIPPGSTESPRNSAQAPSRGFIHLPSSSLSSSATATPIVVPESNAYKTPTSLEPCPLHLQFSPPSSRAPSPVAERVIVKKEPPSATLPSQLGFSPAAEEPRAPPIIATANELARLAIADKQSASKSNSKERPKLPNFTRNSAVRGKVQASVGDQVAQESSCDVPSTSLATSEGRLPTSSTVNLDSGQQEILANVSLVTRPIVPVVTQFPNISKSAPILPATQLQVLASTSSQRTSKIAPQASQTTSTLTAANKQKATIPMLLPRTADTTPQASYITSVPLPGANKQANVSPKPIYTIATPTPRASPVIVGRTANYSMPTPPPSASSTLPAAKARKLSIDPSSPLTNRPFSYGDVTPQHIRTGAITRDPRQQGSVGQKRQRSPSDCREETVMWEMRHAISQAADRSRPTRRDDNHD